MDHLNIGKSLIINENEKLKLSKLNLRAAYKAKLSMAYQSSEKYLLTSMDLLPTESWKSHYDFTFEVYYNLAKISLFTQNYETAESLYPLLLQKAQSNLEKVQVYIVQIEQYALLGRLAETIETGKKALLLLDINIPESLQELDAFLARQLGQISELILDKDIEEIANAKSVDDVRITTTMQVINYILTSTFFTGEWLLLGTLAALQSNLSLQYGNSRFSGFGYVNLGVYYFICLDDIENGLKFGKIAMSVSEKLQDKSTFCRVIVYYHVFLAHFDEPTENFHERFERGFQYAIESGDLPFAGFQKEWKMLTRFFQGHNLYSERYNYVILKN